MQFYDVIIVGAGPAGSTAAFKLSRAGLKVLLLEKFRLPRDKPCGGAVMYRGLQLAGRIPRTIVERKVYGMRFILPDGFRAEFKSSRLIGITTHRAVFDEYLARRAENAGAIFLEEARVISAKVTSEYASVSLADGREFRSLFLIGADGVNSVVSRSLGLRPWRKDLSRIGLGMESDFEIGEQRVLEVCNGDPSILEILPVKGRVSYGWVFPKKSSLAIGIAGAGIHMHPLRPLFDRFVHDLEKRFGFELQPAKRRTHFLGADGVRNENVTTRAILVGDAAGFVDPMMGEGIAYAMRSGLHAARVILEAFEFGRYDKQFLSKFDAICRKEFGANFAMAEWAGLKGISFAKSVLAKATRLRLSSEIMCMVARGEIGYSQIPATVIRLLPFELPQLLREYIRARI